MGARKYDWKEKQGLPPKISVTLDGRPELFLFVASDMLSSGNLVYSLRSLSKLGNEPPLLKV